MIRVELEESSLPLLFCEPWMFEEKIQDKKDQSTYFWARGCSSIYLLQIIRNKRRVSRKRLYFQRNIRERFEIGFQLNIDDSVIWCHSLVLIVNFDILILLFFVRISAHDMI